MPDNASYLNACSEAVGALFHIYQGKAKDISRLKAAGEKVIPLVESKDHTIWISRLSDGLRLIPVEYFCLLCAFLCQFSRPFRQNAEECYQRVGGKGEPGVGFAMEVYEAAVRPVDQFMFASRCVLERLLPKRPKGGLSLRLRPAVFQLLCGSVPYREGVVHETVEDLPEPMADGWLQGLLLRCQQRATHDTPCVILLTGPEKSGKTYHMRLLSRRTETPLLLIDASALPRDADALRETVDDLLLELLLSPSMVCLTHYEDTPESISVVRTLQGGTDFLCVTARENKKLPFFGNHVLCLHYPLTAKGFSEQKTIWMHYFANFGLEPPPGLDAVCNQYRLGVGQIEQYACSWRNRLWFGMCETGFTLRDVVRKGVRHGGMDGLARVVTPKFRWQDIILPEQAQQAMRRICLCAKQRAKVFEGWGYAEKFPYGAGLSVLFSGPPGTGKTMAAHVIANALQTDLLCVSLPNLMSQYIGETEKKLQKLFAKAAEMRAVLFFDEADAVFSQSAVSMGTHGRYANVQTAYLLQCIEEYDGVVILATNLLSNLNAASKRRMRDIVYFHPLDKEGRLRLWETVFPEGAPLSPLISLELLAKKELGPGVIKNIALTAACLGAEHDEITMECLNEALRIELQKDGSLSIKDDTF